MVDGEPAPVAGARSCAVCGATGSVPALQKDGYGYVACEGCGALRLDPLPAPEVAAALYDESYFTESTSGGYHDYLADEAIHRRNARRHLDRLEGLGARPPGRLHEVGAAAGFLLDEARTRGWDPVGVEVAPIADHARDELGLAVHRRVTDLPGPTGPSEGFDASVMNQVLEHLPAPDAALAEVAARLAPGGVLTIETWNRDAQVARRLGAGWQQVTPPSVLWLFSAEDLRRLLAAAGFTDVTVARATKWVSMATVLGQSADDTGPLRRLADSRVGAIGLPYHLGGLVVGTARRTR